MKRFRLTMLLAVSLAWMPLLAVGESTHTVLPGETIYAISRRYGVPVERILHLNDISDPTSISVGRRLAISSQYKVQRGDTYYGIARRFDISVDRLLAHNDRDGSEILRPGESLQIPTGQPTEQPIGTDAAPSSTAPSPSIAKFQTRLADSEASGFWPLVGRREPMEGKFPGIMIYGNQGDKVHSVSNGRVIYAGEHTAFGRIVFVQNEGGYIYVYGGQNDLEVKVGDVVSPGALIGQLGAIRIQSAPRLYFSVWRNDSYIDPVRAPRS